MKNVIIWFFDLFNKNNETLVKSEPTPVVEPPSPIEDLRNSIFKNELLSAYQKQALEEQEKKNSFLATIPTLTCKMTEFLGKKVAEDSANLSDAYYLSSACILSEKLPRYWGIFANHYSNMLKGCGIKHEIRSFYIVIDGPSIREYFQKNSKNNVI